MSLVTIGWVLVTIGFMAFLAGTFVYRENAPKWFRAHADIIVSIPGLAIYITGLCILFEQASHI